MQKNALWLATALLLLAGGAVAQEVETYDFVDTVTITSVDGERGRIGVQDREGRDFEVLIDGDTAILRGDEAIPTRSLAAGDRLVVEARRETEEGPDGQRLVADRLVVVVDPPSVGAGPAAAGTSGAGVTTHGRVVSTDVEEGTLGVETGSAAGSPLVFEVGESGLSVDGVPATLADVELGDRVAVEHGPGEGSASTPTPASRVRVERAGHQPEPSGDAAGQPILDP